MIKTINSNKIISVVSQVSATVGSISFTVPTGCYFEGHIAIAGTTSGTINFVYALTNAGGGVIYFPNELGGGVGVAGAVSKYVVLGAGTWTLSVYANAMTGANHSATGIIKRAI
jgi:hypothetical protein